MGRFIIWTKSAFDQLDSIFGKLPSQGLLHVTSHVGTVVQSVINSQGAHLIVVSVYTCAASHHLCGNACTGQLHVQQSTRIQDHALNTCGLLYMKAVLYIVLKVLHQVVLTDIDAMNSRCLALSSQNFTWCHAGTVEAASEQKKGYKLPRAPMTNSDLTRLINSDEVQSVVRPKKTVSVVQPVRVLSCVTGSTALALQSYGCI